MQNLFNKSLRYHIPFKKQRNWGSRGMPLYSKIEELWWALGEEHLGWSEANQWDLAAQVIFVLWGSREAQWKGGWGIQSRLKWDPRESENSLPQGVKRADLQVEQGAWERKWAGTRRMVDALSSIRLVPRAARCSLCPRQPWDNFTVRDFASRSWLFSGEGPGGTACMASMQTQDRQTGIFGLNPVCHLFP